MKKQKVLITGAGTGLGKRAAFLLAEHGHLVYATTQFESEAINLEKEAKKYNLNNLKSFKLDIRLKEDREKILEYDFDVIINNAGIGDSRFS